MHERKHSGSYEVNDRPGVAEETGWCPTRNIPVCMATLCSCIIYLLGAIITGVAYHVQALDVECRWKGSHFNSTKVHVYESPLVVVGPCLMSSGGTLFLYLVIQWLLCRPTLKQPITY